MTLIQPRAAIVEYANSLKIDHELNIDDLVWFSKKGIKLKRPYLKLNFRRIVPFKIHKFINKIF